MRCILTVPFLLPIIAASQTLTYGWPAIGMDPCTAWIGCENGCSGCNSPLGGNAALLGTTASWFQVGACPHAAPNGNNIVYTTGWGAAPGDAKVVFSFFAMQELQVDSIIITHHGAVGGSERLHIRFGINTILPGTVIHDAAIVQGEQRTVITGPGCLTVPEGEAYGTAQLILQAYEGGDGWWLDEVRIVTSDHLAMSVQQLGSTPTLRARPVFDLHGRSVARDPVQGLYLDAQGRRVVVVE